MYQATISHFADLAHDKADAAARGPVGFFVGAMLAGAYIGIAMILALSAAAGLPPGVRPLVMGALFGVGLILAVFAGAELFTGYVLYVTLGLVRRTIGGGDAVRLILLVWLGNLAGALVLAGLFAAGGGGAIFAAKDAFLQTYVAHKVDAGVVPLLARAILCNWLVCLAIWTAARVQGDAAKCLVIAWVLTAFVTSGFEHSVANMTALTLGLLIPDPSVSILGVARNLGLVTLGNMIGGAVFVAGAYLVAARTDPPGPARRRDAGSLSTVVRALAAPAAD
jgi:nitrite transporter NirC